MRVRWSFLRSFAALVAALAAGHLTQAFRPEAQALTVTTPTETAAPAPVGDGVPKSASLASGLSGGAPELTGITAVAAVVEAPGTCPATLTLVPRAGAMIDLALAAPCNRGERIVVRHAGLSFAARTDANGNVRLQVPAMQSEAMVAVYLEGSAVVLGAVAVPEADTLRRFAFQWSSPGRFDLRVTEDDRVFVGTGTAVPDLSPPKVLSLGTATVQSPIFAEVYTFPPGPAAEVELTVELRIDAETCGQTLTAQIIASDKGEVSLRNHPIAVPLCGTSGDILVLKNLAQDLTLAPRN